MKIRIDDLGRGGLVRSDRPTLGMGAWTSETGHAAMSALRHRSLESGQAALGQLQTSGFTQRKVRVGSNQEIEQTE
ncbi:hypothetical protein [Microvirga sp.]|uniref:hypothetical protein n=1 Tax=Microvirga sp. TaxID=1873136 RepID=UPI001684B704|nr:hypothetical protein [Microvirga sp.]